VVGIAIGIENAFAVGSIPTPIPIPSGQHNCKRLRDFRSRAL